LVEEEFLDRSRNFYSGSMGLEELTKILLPCGETRFYENGFLVKVEFPDDEHGDDIVPTSFKNNVTPLAIFLFILLTLVLVYLWFVFTRPGVLSNDRHLTLAYIRTRRDLRLPETNQRVANAYKKRILMLHRSEDAKRRAAERLQRDQEEALLRAQEAKKHREEQIRRREEIHERQAQEEADKERRRREILDEERRARRENQYQNGSMQPRVLVGTQPHRRRNKKHVVTPEEEEQARVRKINGLRAQRAHEDYIKRQRDDMIAYQFWQEQQLHIADLIGRLD
jgi:hypothetical protein